jgi:hypothetical protein
MSAALILSLSAAAFATATVVQAAIAGARVIIR